MYLTGRLLHHTHRKHIQPTHKHLRAVPKPASLLGTALGPEGPRCRRRIGVGGWQVQRRRQRERQVRGEYERERDTVMTLLNVTTALKTPTNLLAGNERTGGRGGGVEGWRERGKRRGLECRVKSSGGSSCMGREGVGEGWSDRWQDERDGDKQPHHFSSLLTGLLSTTRDDRRQNGHPNKHQCSCSDTHLSNRSTAASGAIKPTKGTICHFSIGL